MSGYLTTSARYVILRQYVDGLDSDMAAELDWLLRACAYWERQTIALRAENDELSDEIDALLRDACARGDEHPPRHVLTSPDGKTAHVGPFTCVRSCIDCGVLLDGGPTRCMACVRHMEAEGSGDA